MVKQFMLRAPNWNEMITGLMADGLTPKQIGARMGIELSTKMISCYLKGVQPIHFRGEALIGLWCEHFGRERVDVPMGEVGYRSHRKARAAADLSPKMANAAVLMAAIRPPVQQVKQQGARRAPRLPAASGVLVHRVAVAADDVDDSSVSLGDQSCRKSAAGSAP